MGHGLMHTEVQSVGLSLRKSFDIPSHLVWHRKHNVHTATMSAGQAAEQVVRVLYAVALQLFGIDAYKLLACEYVHPNQQNMYRPTH